MAIGTSSGGYFDTEFDFVMNQSPLGILDPVGKDEQYDDTPTRGQWSRDYDTYEYEKDIKDKTPEPWNPSGTTQDRNEVDPNYLPDTSTPPEYLPPWLKFAQTSTGTLSDSGPIISNRPIVQKYGQPIKNIESGGGNYSLKGPVDPKSGARPLGAYQIMEFNVAPWTKAALGKELTPEQFLKDKDAQDAVFEHRFGGYVEKYGVAGASRAWIGGETGMKNLNAKDVLGTSVGAYEKRFLAQLNAPQSAGTSIPKGQIGPRDDFEDRFGQWVDHVSDGGRMVTSVSDEHGLRADSPFPYVDAALKEMGVSVKPKEWGEFIKGVRQSKNVTFEDKNGKRWKWVPQKGWVEEGKPFTEHLYKKSEESMDDYTKRMKPFNDGVIPLQEAYAKKINKPIEKWTPKDIEKFRNTDEFKDLIKRTK